MHKMLEGIKVVDMTLAMAGPGSTKLLAEWGADVIHIESLVGDMNRTIDMEFPNMNKRDITVNIKDPRGLQIIYDLVKDADFFVTNYRPKAIERMGISYEKISSIKPNIIYGIITGYGETGPDVEAPGYDTVAYWARSGMQMDFPEADTAPVVCPSCVGDIAAAIDLVAGMMAAYVHMLKTGKGEKVMVSLLAHGLYLNFDAIRKAEYGIKYPQSRKSPTKPLINTFRGSDGEWFSMTALYDRFIPPILEICNRQDLIGKPGYRTYDEVNEHSSEIVGIIDEGFSHYTRAELLDKLSAAGIPCSKIGHIKDTLTDPQAWANNYFMHHTYRNGHKVTLPVSPIQFGDIEIPDHKNAPLLGEHTVEVMKDLGYTQEQIDTYIKEKVVSDVVPNSDHDWFSDYGYEKK